MRKRLHLSNRFAPSFIVLHDKKAIDTRISMAFLLGNNKLIKTQWRAIQTEVLRQQRSANVHL